MNTFIRQSGRKDSKKDIYTAIKKKIKNVILYSVCVCVCVCVFTFMQL